MKRSIRKYWASIMAILLLFSIYAVPAKGAAAPNFAKRQTNIYDGRSYSYTVKNVPKGGSVKWSVTGAGKGYIKLSKTTGKTVKATVKANGRMAAKNSTAQVQAKVYNRSKKLVKTVGDAVKIKISATDSSIVAPKDVDIEEMALGTYRFRVKMIPANSTSYTYYAIQGVNGESIDKTAAFVDAKGYVTLNAPGAYNLLAEAKNARTGKTVASDSITIKCDPESQSASIKQKQGGDVPPSIYVGDTLSLALAVEIKQRDPLSAKILPVKVKTAPGTVYRNSYFPGIGSSEKEEEDINFKAYRESGMEYEWSVSNHCATIGQDGVLKAISAGNIVITCSFENNAKEYRGSVSVDLQVLDKPPEQNAAATPVHPEITGAERIALSEGYPDTEYTYSVTGYPLPKTSLEEGTNTAQARMREGKATIPSGLGEGDYSFTLIAENRKGKARKVVEVKVVPKEEEPVITGDSVINLEEGYGDVEYQYSVTGYPLPETSLEEGTNTARARMREGKATIPSGLGEGDYSFTLIAENRKGKARKVVEVKVVPKEEEPVITGDSVINLEEGYGDVEYQYSVTGYPLPETSLEEGTNTARARMREGKVTIPSGLAAGNYSFTLIAENRKGKTRKIVEVNVDSQFTKPVITGLTEIHRLVSSPTQRYQYQIKGNPAPDLQLLAPLDFAAMEGDWLIVYGGLSASVSPHQIKLVAENVAGQTELTIKIYVYDNISLTVSSKETVAGRKFEWTLNAQGGAGGPYKYEIAEGEFPQGLTLSPDGTITGTPTEELETSKVCSVKVKVTDQKNNSTLCDVSLYMYP